MQLEIVIRKVLVGLSAVIVAEAVNAQEPGHLAVADEAPVVSIKQLSWHGRQGPHEYKLVADLNGSKAGTVRGYSGSKSLGSALVPNEIKELDLGSVRLGSYRPGSLQAKFRFGPKRLGCFTNDDGRDFLSISFIENKRPVVSVTSLEGCGGAAR